MDYEFRFSSIAGCSTVPPCKVKSPGGKVYDLTDFIGVSPITASDDVGKWQYSVTVCQNHIHNCAICSPAGYCQKSTSGETYCVGTYQNISGNDDGTGVTLYYEEPVEGRKGQVKITCDPAAKLVNDITAFSPSISYAACPQRPSCKVAAPDGSAYDLDSLVLLQPLTAVDAKKEWSYTVSICQNSLPQCASVNPAGYCQHHVSNDQVYCIGVFDSIEGLNNGEGVKLTYKEDILGRKGTVNIGCDPNGPIVGNIEAISPLNKEDYQFNFKSNAACKKNSKKMNLRT